MSKLKVLIVMLTVTAVVAADRALYAEVDTDPVFASEHIMKLIAIEESLISPDTKHTIDDLMECYADGLVVVDVPGTVIGKGNAKARFDASFKQKGQQASNGLETHSVSKIDSARTVRKGTVVITMERFDYASQNGNTTRLHFATTFVVVNTKDGWKVATEAHTIRSQHATRPVSDYERRIIEEATRVGTQNAFENIMRHLEAAGR